jgi:hypothetical protein
LQFLKSSQRLYDTQWLSLGSKVVKLDMQNFAPCAQKGGTKNSSGMMNYPLAGGCEWCGPPVVVLGLSKQNGSK